LDVMLHPIQCHSHHDKLGKPAGSPIRLPIVVRRIFGGKTTISNNWPGWAVGRGAQKRGVARNAYGTPHRYLLIAISLHYRVPLTMAYASNLFAIFISAVFMLFKR